MKTDFHHVYSKGEMVIFRDADDYIYFQNRLAIDKYGKNIKILAFSIMSTHVHLIVETLDENALQEFLSNIKRAYAIHYKSKYNYSLPAEYLKFEYSDETYNFGIKKGKIIYVIKNPVHHQICGSPFSYEYSSAKFTFLKDIFGESASRIYVNGLKKVSELGGRDVRKIFGRNKLDDDSILVDQETGAIAHISIIDTSKTQAYWNNYFRGYVLDLHLKPKDSSGDYINEDALCVQTEKISDIEVCKIIDDVARACGVGSYLNLKGEALRRLIETLYQMSASKSQIERCLWIQL